MRRSRATVPENAPIQFVVPLYNKSLFLSQGEKMSVQESVLVLTGYIFSQCCPLTDHKF